MPKNNNRYPHTLEDAHCYIFIGYIAQFGADKIGVRDAITQILIDLDLDPKSRDDRKWAVNKFRKANPNNHDPEGVANHRCKQEYYDYYKIQSTIAASNFLEMERWDHNRTDAMLQQLIKTLQMEVSRADWNAVPLNIKMQLLLEAIGVKMISGDRKMEIASLTLKLQEQQETEDGRIDTDLRTGLEDEKEEEPSEP